MKELESEFLKIEETGVRGFVYRLQSPGSQVTPELWVFSMELALCYPHST
jgi:hypothetical protein